MQPPDSGFRFDKTPAFTAPVKIVQRLASGCVLFPAVDFWTGRANGLFLLVIAPAVALHSFCPVTVTHNIFPPIKNSGCMPLFSD